MNMLKLIWQTLIRLPANIADIFKQRRRQTVLNEHETERLDRIRNPTKYRGNDFVHRRSAWKTSRHGYLRYCQIIHAFVPSR